MQVTPFRASQSKATMWMFTAFVIGALLMAALPYAHAAKPSNQACLGHDISGYAVDGTTGGAVTFDGGPGFGKFVSGLASSIGVDGQQGVGGEFQNHLAGNVPDEIIPNTCND